MKTSPKEIIIGGILFLLGLVILIGIVWRVYQTSQESTNPVVIELSDERLSDIYALTDNRSLGRAHSLYAFVGGLQEDILPQYAGSIIDYKKQNNQEVLLVVDGLRQNLVFRNSPNKEFQTLLSDFSFKRGVTFSTDGQMIYFAENSNENAIQSPGSWIIKSYNLTTGEYGEVALGFAPQIISVSEGTDVMIYTTNKGFEARNLVDMSVYSGQDLTGQSVEKPILVSPNGTYVLVHNQLLGTYDVYTLTIADPLLLKPMFSIAESEIQEITDTAVFFIDSQSQSIVAYSLEKSPRGQDIYMFPSETNIPARIISK